MDILKQIERENMRMDMPAFRSGDTVKVHLRIVEGEKERIQIFQGNVIRIKRGTTNATFTVRKVSDGVGVERIFPMNSPFIDHVELITQGGCAAAASTTCATSRAKPPASSPAAVSDAAPPPLRERCPDSFARRPGCGLPYAGGFVVPCRRAAARHRPLGPRAAPQGGIDNAPFLSRKGP